VGVSGFGSATTTTIMRFPKGAALTLLPHCQLADCRNIELD